MARPPARACSRRGPAGVFSLLLLLCAGPAPAQEAVVARSLAATCAGCHGTQGRPRNEVLPPLAGMKPEAMLAALDDYRSGRRPGAVMPQIVKGYTEAQLRLVAGYFAAQPAPVPKVRP